MLRSARLVTLTGPGGVSKTRLAIAVAEELADDFADGVCMVDLAPLREGALVGTALGSALNLREEPGRSLIATLQEALRPRQLLLLDNCEHLLTACAELASALLQTCPHLRLLATSRQTLGLTGEVAWSVPALATPALGSLHSTERPTDKEWMALLLEYEALQLFAARARQAVPHFQITAQNVGAVAQVCAQLDGMPLAIELAAAWVRALSVEQIAARLDDRFGLLQGGQPHGAAASADAARHNGLELRSAHGAGAAAAGSVSGVCRRLELGSGGGRLHKQ